MNIGNPSSTARSTDPGLPPVPSQIRSGRSGRGTISASSNGRRRCGPLHVTRSWLLASSSRSSFEAYSRS
jgi:hypothetical protein